LACGCQGGFEEWQCHGLNTLAGDEELAKREAEAFEEFVRAVEVRKIGLEGKQVALPRQVGDKLEVVLKTAKKKRAGMELSKSRVDDENYPTKSEILSNCFISA